MAGALLCGCAIGMSGARKHSLATAIALLAIGCAHIDGGPSVTTVILDNKYPPAGSPLVVYQAYWFNVSFQNPVAPGASSDPQSAIPASENAAYVLLAPGWDPSNTAPPTRLMALESRSGFAVALGDTLHIPVDDVTFAGNCVAENQLTQTEADFLTQIVFASSFSGLRYNATTCTTTPIGDGRAP